MDDPKVLFGNKIRILRQRLGWSQERLALECNLDRSYIGEVERGERNIALMNIFKIAKALKVQPGELLNFKGLKGTKN